MSKKTYIFIIFLITVLAIIYGFYRFVLYKEKIDYETIDYDSQNNWLKEVYNAHPSIFEFDSNGVCKITMEQLHTLQDDIDMYFEQDNMEICVWDILL